LDANAADDIITTSRAITAQGSILARPNDDIWSFGLYSALLPPNPKKRWSYANKGQTRPWASTARVRLQASLPKLGHIPPSQGSSWTQKRPFSKLANGVHIDGASPEHYANGEIALNSMEVKSVNQL
jgi:hypothetical protein